MEAPIMCSPYDRIVHVRRRMIDEDAWWMMAVDDGKLAGVVTESDIAKALSKFRDLVKEKYQDARVRKIIVDDVMTADVISVWTNTPCEEVVAVMLEKDVEGVPVLDLKETLVGMITKGTILKNL
ncbi:MAG TPA: CBS domain-containing protein [Candidatus Acidoferrum sp.]|nr:CBS domain-containing protein [Candidatus Acidoferrum sp.]